MKAPKVEQTFGVFCLNFWVIIVNILRRNLKQICSFAWIEKINRSVTKIRSFQVASHCFSMGIYCNFRKTHSRKRSDSGLLPNAFCSIFPVPFHSYYKTRKFKGVTETLDTAFGDWRFYGFPLVVFLLFDQSFQCIYRAELPFAVNAFRRNFRTHNL